MKSSVLTRLVRVDEWDAMCAEVERLRVVNADLRLMIDGLETAAHEERAAVVAWLDAREEALTAEANAAQTEGRRTWAFTRASEAAYAALVVERGEHHRTPAEKEKP